MYYKYSYGNNNVSKPLIVGICVIVGIIIFAVYAFCFSPKDHSMTVEKIQWECTVHVVMWKQQKHVHETSYPTDAYNIHEKTEYSTDSNGNSTSHKYYDYYVDRWVKVREVNNYGVDKNPVYKEPELAVGKTDIDRVTGRKSAEMYGEERESYRETKYYVWGKPVSSDESSVSLTRLEIPQSIWNNLTLNDELNYLKSRAGQPYEISIAK